MKEVFKIRTVGRNNYCKNWSCAITVSHIYDLIKAGHEVDAIDGEGNDVTQELLARVAKTCVKIKSKENLYNLIRSE